MSWLVENYKLIYTLVLGILLLLSWYFYKSSQYDERRKNRFGIKSLKRRKAQYQEKLFNAEYEAFFRKSGLPGWITSVRLNLIRFVSLFVLLFIVVLEFLTTKDYISTFELILWGSIPVILIPKRPYPFYFLVHLFSQRYTKEISNEVYQLYNEIKSNFKVRNNGSDNSYYTIKNALPYYKKIRPTMEKMLPYLEKKDLSEAWETFSHDLGTKESSMLAIVMKEVESLEPRQALLLLEQKRQEFSNHLYNRYTDYLRRRKTVIFTIVVFGAMMVFINEVTVFFMWYKEIMSVANRFG